MRVLYLGVETTYWDNLKAENASLDPGMNMKNEKKKKNPILGAFLAISGGVFALFGAYIG